MKRIAIKGKAGHGIQLLGFLLANILKDNKYHVSLVREYSPLVRSGDSDVYIVYSKQKIENPIIEDCCDLVYDMSDKKYSELLKKGKFMNTFLLGMILKKLNFKLDVKLLKSYLSKKKFLEENMKAIKEGYSSNL